MRCILLFCIRAYQVTVSPDHGPLKMFYPYGYCQFHPTCSTYGYGSIERFGAIKGSWMAFRRILRCHPWSNGGFDPVPEK